MANDFSVLYLHCIRVPKRQNIYLIRYKEYIQDAYRRCADQFTLQTEESVQCLKRHLLKSNHDYLER